MVYVIHSLFFVCLVQYNSARLDMVGQLQTKKIKPPKYVTFFWKKWLCTQKLTDLVFCTQSWMYICKLSNRNLKVKKKLDNDLKAIIERTTRDIDYIYLGYASCLKPAIDWISVQCKCAPSASNWVFFSLTIGYFIRVPIACRFWRLI